MSLANKYCGNAKMQTGQYGIYGNVTIDLEQLMTHLGIDYATFKKLIAPLYDKDKKQFSVPYLNSWTSKDGSKTHTNLKLKIASRKDETHYVALDEFVNNSETKVKDFPEENNADDLPF